MRAARSLTEKASILSDSSRWPMLAKTVKLLGRPKGPGKSKLDKHKEEIVALLKNGSRQNYVAKRYGTTPANLCNWLKKHNIDTTPILPE